MTATPSAIGVLADPAFPRLKDYVIGTTGLAYYADKDGLLAGHLARRMAASGAADGASYLAILQTGAAGQVELDALIEELTIGETFFFRHREMFDALRDVVLPDLLRPERAGWPLRVWSAGCSVGAEAYSVSIVLRRELAARSASREVRIVGTDINRAFLAQAGAAEFGDWAMRGMPDEVRRAYFEPRDKNWRLRPEFREGVSFQYHNLVTDQFPSHVNDLFAFDLILCRNVTIYFQLELVRRILRHFHDSLVDGGWLLVGHAEPNVELFRDFRTVNVPGAVLYQKGGPRDPAPAPVPFSTMPTWMPTWVPPLLPPLTIAAPPPVPSLPAAPASDEPLAAIRVLADRGDWAEAARRCDEALQRDRLRPAVHFYQALVLEQLGGRAAAESAVRRALYLDRSFVLAHYFLGLLLQKAGDGRQAARSFRNVLELLARVPQTQVYADGDGITASELGRLARMQLEVLGA